MDINDLLDFAEAEIDQSGFNVTGHNVSYYFDDGVVVFEWTVFPGFVLRLELQRENGELVKGPFLVREADEQE